MINLKKTFQELASDERFVQEVSELIKNKLFYEEHSKFFTVVQDIRARKQVGGITGIEEVSIPDEGCGSECTKPEIPAFSQFWDPRPVRICLNWCYTDFENKFTQWGLAKGYDKHKLDEANFFKFILELVVDAILMDFQRIALFGDENIARQSILANPAKEIYFKLIDKGLIPTLQYFKTMDEFEDNFIELTQNAADKPFDFTQDYAKNLYEELVDSDNFTGDMLLTSNKLYRNYASYFKNYYSLQSSKDEIQKGLRNLMVDGETIVPYKNYDIWNKRYFTKNGKPHLPHFAIYTKKENLQIGIDSEESLTNLTFEYPGGKDETFYIKGSYRMDFKIVNPYAFKAAI